MIQKLLIDLAIKKISKKFKLNKLIDYVEKPNQADDRIDKLEIDVAIIKRKLKENE